mgnify:CR=1 FL=1
MGWGAGISSAAGEWLSRRAALLLPNMACGALVAALMADERYPSLDECWLAQLLGDLDTFTDQGRGMLLVGTPLGCLAANNSQSSKARRHSTGEDLDRRHPEQPRCALSPPSSPHLRAASFPLITVMSPRGASKRTADGERGGAVAQWPCSTVFPRSGSRTRC